MKRVLSLVLALVLVLGMIPMGFAADATAGQTLKGYGIIAGDENGNLNEDQNLNRAEMMVVLARMMGKGAEAQAFALPSTFTDLAGFGWAVPWIAYAEMNEWTAGVGANMFNPAGNVTAQEAAVFMLKALGYEADVDFTWANAVEFATAKGLFAGVDTAATSPILRGDLFTMMITTLNTEVKAGTGLLGVVLGYMENPELEVVSVKALNLVQVEVKFNMAVDADTAEDIDNYELTNDDGDDLLTNWNDTDVTFDLQDDEKTVIITHLKAVADEDVDQQTEAVLEIDGVEAADNEDLVIDEFVSDVFEYGDVTIPKAVKAEVIGIDTIKVTFSEPIDADTFEADQFEVDGGDFIINAGETALLKNNTEANVVLYSELEDGKVSIEVGGMDDYAGFNVVKTTFELNVVEDNDAPVVVGYKDAKTTEVTLIFNEDIRTLFDNDDLGNNYEAYFYHTNAANKVDANGYAIDGNELTLDFGLNTLPEGTAYVYVASDAVEDYWENANNKIVTKVEIDVDNTAPVLEKIDVDLNETDEDEVEVTLTFSEDIDHSTIEEDAFTLVDEDGEEVGFSVADYTAATDEIVLTFDDIAADVSGTYKITIVDLEDTSGNEIAKVTETFEVDDLVAPVIADFQATLYNASDEDQLLKIDFDEKMATEGAYSVLQLEKYMIDGVSLEDFEDEYGFVPTIKLVDNGEAVEITIASSEDDDEDFYNMTVASEVMMGRVADAAGNKSTELADIVPLKGAGYVEVDSVEVTADDTIVVTFDDRLTTFKSADLSFYADDTTGTAITPSRISTTTNTDGDTVVTVKTNQTLGYDGKYNGADIYLVVDIYSATAPSENIYGEPVKEGETMADDAYAPEIAEFDEDQAATGYIGTAPDKDDLKVLIDYTTDTAATITIEFTEVIDQDSLSRLAFSVDNAKVISINSMDTKFVTIVIASEDGEKFDMNERLVITQKYAVSDASDNEFKSDTTLRPFVVK